MQGVVIVLFSVALLVAFLISIFHTIIPGIINDFETTMPSYVNACMS